MLEPARESGLLMLWSKFRLSNGKDALIITLYRTYRSAQGIGTNFSQTQLSWYVAHPSSQKTFALIESFRVPPNVSLQIDAPESGIWWPLSGVLRLMSSHPTSIFITP